MAIKMICSDIDGTLLQYGRKKLEGEIFDQIRALHDRGILFCPASGRQYTSLRLLFAPVVCLLCTGWFFVRWKNEHDDEALAQKNRKICRGFLIATVISLVVFGGLHLLFPITL